MGGTVVADVLQKDGAHGAPYVQIAVYAWPRVGCAVRTKAFCRPGRGLHSDIRGRGNQTVIFARNKVYSFVQCRKGSRHGTNGLEPLPCRKRGSRNATTFEIPVGP